MKLFKKVLTGVALAAALATSAQASMITVGGVTWDPDATGTLADNDFTARFDLIQWFTSSANAVSNDVNAAPDPSKAIDPTLAATGDILQGVGKVSKLNNSSTFANGGELTFVFGGFSVTSATTFGGGWLKIYHDATPDYDSGAGTGANDGTLWLSLTSDFNVFAGTALNVGNLTSYFSAVGGDAFGNFEGANLPGYFGADAQSTAVAQFEGLYATTGGSIKSNSVPEPTSLALLGLGLIGAAAARRKSAK